VFEIVFERLKNAFNIQKIRLKKKKKKNHLFGKKIKSAFKGPKSLKIAKKHFWQKLENEAFAQKLFLT
jgi:hypothetical protein